MKKGFVNTLGVPIVNNFLQAVLSQAYHPSGNALTSGTKNLYFWL